jgi:hypothetical protein
VAYPARAFPYNIGRRPGGANTGRRPPGLSYQAAETPSLPTARQQSRFVASPARTGYNDSGGMLPGWKATQHRRGGAVKRVEFGGNGSGKGVTVRLFVKEGRKGDTCEKIVFISA